MGEKSFWILAVSNAQLLLTHRVNSLHRMEKISELVRTLAQAQVAV